MALWKLAHHKEIDLSGHAILMGILNVTPDSFSDGGRYKNIEEIIDSARYMFDQGAAIIDVGAESTRPNGYQISAEEEQKRLLPVLERLSAIHDMIISVDTYRAQTARLAIEAGAHIINDVWGLQKEPEIADICAAYNAGLVIMHTGREREVHPDVIEDQKLFLDKSLAIARSAGVKSEQIVLDPGFGFAKEYKDNLELMRRAAELKQFGFPLLAGTSRKRFVGALTGRDEPVLRDVGTASTSVILRLSGFKIFRVHNVAFNKDALNVVDAMMDNSNEI